MTRVLSQSCMALALMGLTLAVPRPAAAKVTLPDGTVIPKPPIGCYSGKPGGLRQIFACACKSGTCNIGSHCSTGSGTDCPKPNNGVCEATIWYKINENTCIPSNIDPNGLVPQRDAAVKPETFRPACGLTFTLLTRGGAMFKNGFGWYNVVPGKKPDIGDLYPLIDCTTPEKKVTNFSLLNNPNYKGGDIGFYLVTPEDPNNRGQCASGTNCCASLAHAKAGKGYIYYSQPQYNPDNKGAGSYIHLLLYNSKIFSHTFYFAWEDTYDGTSTDYSDFVTSVSGISCAGAGVTCTVSGAKGICQMGVTRCDADGNLVCEAVFKGEAEKCDGLDNDCDGVVDNGATCPGNQICYQGVCLAPCSASSEFACQIGYECDTQKGYCVDKACKTVTCKSGEICRLGKCSNGCEGVTCPRDQICQGGLCIDPCEGRSCNQGEICKHGICLPDCTKCGGVTCVGSLLCDTQTGDCYNPACNPKCSAGTYCKNGKCVDFCDGVICPGGTTCKNGKCPPPGVGDPKSSTDSQAPWTLDTGGVEPGTDGGGSGTTGPKKGFVVDDSGCTCQLGAGPDAGSAGLFGLLLAAAALLLRRRR